MIEAPFRRIKSDFADTLMEDVYQNHNRRVALFNACEGVSGVIWNSSVEDYFSTNKSGTPVPAVARAISELSKIQIYSFALDGLVSKIEKNEIRLEGKSGENLKVYLADNIPKPERGDMVRIFATPLDDKFLSAGTFAFYLRNYSLEEGTSGLNSPYPKFEEELIRTKYPGLDDTLKYGNSEDTIRNSTKRLIDRIRETKQKHPKRIEQPTFTFDHNTVSQEVENAAYEGLIKMAYIPQPPSDSRNYGMRLVSLGDASILRYLLQRGGSIEEIFIPEGEKKFKVLGRITKGKEAIKRIGRLLGTPRQIVLDDRLDKFFHMCKEAREGRVSSDEIMSMLN